MEIVGTLSTEKMKKSNPVPLDVNRVAKSVREDLEILHPFSDKYCIYRVTERLRELNEKAYTPQVVSIGPIHHGKENLKAMDEREKMYLQEFIGLSTVGVEDLVKGIQESETRLRNCYAETIEFSGESSVKMILMDAAFIIMSLLKYKSNDFRGSIDRIFYRPWKVREVVIDLCLLENQLPFFILEDLFRLSNVVSYTQECSMIELTCTFLKDLWVSWVREDILGRISSSEVEHFVGFLSLCQKPTKWPLRKRLQFLTVLSVKELHQAGVKIVLSSSKHLLDIKFDESQGRLETPRLLITDILFRNLRVFEQCHDSLGYMNDYIFLIGLLVNAPKDVDLLVQNDIIENVLSNNEAVSILQNLVKGNIVSSEFYFSALLEDLNAYCRRPWNRWKATLKQDYFNTSWAAISVIGALIMLILSVIQSLCSIIQISQF